MTTTGKPGVLHVTNKTLLDVRIWLLLLGCKVCFSVFRVNDWARFLIGDCLFFVAVSSLLNGSILY